MNVLCLVCGLPGAGKSTALRSVRAQQRHVVVLFDEVLAYVLTAHGPDFSGEMWHLAQEAFYALVRELMGTGQEEDMAGMDGRVPGLVEGYLKTHPLPTGAAGEGATWVYAEDNFCYKSMRRRFLRAARTAGWAYTAVWCDCPVKLCVDRNAARADSVNPAIITEMAAQVSRMDLQRDARLAVFNTAQGSTEALVDALLSRCAAAEVLPPMDPDEDAARAQEAREATAASLAHALDQALRKATAALLASVPPPLKKKAGPLVASLRKEALRAAKPRTADDVECAVDTFRASAWKTFAVQ
eukprot:TRINITY_DN16713_c0_g1_i1.p1 TRINITY_DN16713_c0_g1~~TRINITY_DN16713_c0_g1_i1.p1  ORF type:complete len:299 (+),score=47.23 TRINITY_DN16713_c0_g1_i1:190-1086(+)